MQGVPLKNNTLHCAREFRGGALNLDGPALTDAEMGEAIAQS